MDAIVAQLPAAQARPDVTFRMAGDTFVLVEYGAVRFDLELNLYARRVASAIERGNLAGVTDLAPGIRSLLVGFDPAAVSMGELVERLMVLHAASAAGADVPDAGLVGRCVTLPLAFDDAATRDAVARHASTADPQERSVPSDIDEIVAASGLAAPADLLTTVTGQRWCVAFIGYYPGLPFLLPLNGEIALRVPKLVRRRAWTAEGAVTLGGACIAIFPVEAPGSYRAFGRTVPIYALDASNDAFDGDQMLLCAGDIVMFEAVGEDELTEFRRKAYENQYQYKIDAAIGHL